MRRLLTGFVSNPRRSALSRAGGGVGVACPAFTVRFFRIPVRPFDR